MIRRLAIVLSVAGLGLMLAVPVASANPAPSREREENSREQTIRRIQKLLAHPVAQERLAQMGVDRQDLEKKLDKLSDEQLQQLSQRLDSIDSGGSALGFVIAVLIIAALVLLVIYLAERT